MIKRNFISVLRVALVSILILLPPYIHIHSEHSHIKPVIEISLNDFSTDEKECCVDTFEPSSEYLTTSRYVKVNLIKCFFIVIHDETLGSNNFNSKNINIEKEIILTDKLSDIIFYSSDTSPPTI